MMSDDFHFEVRFMNGEQVEGTLGLDEGQVWIEPNLKRIIISVTGAQLKQLAQWNSARVRTKL